jgi:cellulose synthase/poly-beta-1,6-N-acetylglucosamine synthase-like glycosyltransferase
MARTATGWSIFITSIARTRLTEPAGHFAELPRVTVQLPIFNEQYVVDRLAGCRLPIEYPKDRLDIQLLDDSTDETVEVARSVVERYAAMGHPVKYLHRTNRRRL